MGVDAEMLVRVTRDRLSPERVRRIAWEMAGAFGHDKFFISSGGYVRRALEIVDCFEQDGPTLHPAEGEQFIRVGLFGRYYGEGYERGDLPFYIALAKWLEQRLPQEPTSPKVAIWYGADSSGICAEPFGPEQRDALFAHFIRNGHRPYGNWELGEPGFKRTCGFCEEPMGRFAWGGHNMIAGYNCDGCGFEEETRDGGATWVVKKDVGGREVKPVADDRGDAGPGPGSDT